MTAKPAPAPSENSSFVFSREWAVWLAGKHSEAVDHLNKLLITRREEFGQRDIEKIREILNRPYDG